MGYTINANYATGNDLNEDFTNIEVISNRPPFRTDHSDPDAILFPQEFDPYYTDTSPSDYSMTNANTESSPNTSTLNMSLTADQTLDDNDPGDIMKTMDQLIFGIRGVSDGLGNNHNQLELSSDGTSFIYTPLPGFHGRAEFGFYLYDGKEIGALEIYTIDVSLDEDLTFPMDQELIINGSFEDGMELRTVDESGKVYSTFENYFQSQLFDGAMSSGAGRPIGHLIDNIIFEESFDFTYSTLESIDFGFGTFGAPFHSGPWPEGEYPWSAFYYPPRPFPSVNDLPNSRYNYFGNTAYNLVQPLQENEHYTLSFDYAVLNHSSAIPGNAVGDQVEVEFNFYDEYDFQNNQFTLYQTETVTFTIEELITSDAPVEWNTVTYEFQYCNPNPALLIRDNHFLGDASDIIFYDNFSIKKNPNSILLEVNAGEDVNLISDCEPSSTQLIAETSYHSCSLSFEWTPSIGLSNADIYNPIASPSNTTIYTVTVTDINTGATAIDEVTVFVDEFDGIDDFSICLNELPLNLNQLFPYEGPTFTANFLPLLNGFFNPSEPGAYIIQYTFVNSECSLQGSFLITVQGVTPATASHPDGLTVSSSQTLSGNLQFLDDLVIEDGATLTVNNSDFQFSEDSRIHIQPGGRLFVENTVFTNLDCGNFWQGIYVEGISSISQWGSFGQLQGRLTMENSTVSNAVRGVANYGNASLWSTHGGIIQVVGCEFRNCEIAAEIKNYTNNHPNLNIEIPIRCDFYNTDFILDENDFFINSENNPVMKLQQVKDVTLSGCKFLNTNPELFTPPNNSPTKAAIWSNWKASFQMIRGCNGSPPYIINVSDGSCTTGDVTTSIKGFNYGIYNVGSFPSEIDRVTFECFRGVWSRSDNLKMTRNRFKPITSAMAPFVGEDNGTNPNWNVSYGAYLEYSRLFWVEGNTFDYSNNPWWGEVGLIVKSSGPQEHVVYRNNFSDTWMGSLAYDDNRGSSIFSGLHYECNTMNSNAYDIVTFPTESNPDPNWGISQWQGNIFSGESARNEFETNSILNLYHYFPSSIVYFHDISENFQDYFGNITPILINDVEGGCISSFPSGGIGIDFPGELAQGKASADSIKTILDNLVDDGNTEELSTEVILADYTEALGLYYELMSISPALSEKVLVEAINKEFDLPAPLLTLILQSNPHAAKSEKVQKELDDRLLPLADYQRDMINQGLELVSTKEELEAGYAYHKSKISFLLSQRVHEILSDTTISSPIDEIASLIDIYRSPDQYYFLIGLYISNGEMVNGQNMLDQVESHFDLDDRRYAEYQDYQSAYEIWMNLESQNRMQLTNSERMDLEIIAYRKSTLAKGLARSMLSFYDDQQFSEALVEPIFDATGKSNSSKTKTYRSASSITLYPNPSRGLLFIRGVQESDVMAEVFDASGRKVKEVQVDTETSTIELTSFSPGTYNVHLRSRISGMTIHRERIIIIK